MFGSRKKTTRQLIEIFIGWEHMHRAGVPLRDMLKQSAEMHEGTTLGTKLGVVYDSVKSGQKLHEAMEFYPKLFDNAMILLVRMGEKTGKLDLAFAKCVEQVKWRDEHRRKIAKATRSAKISGVIILGLAMFRGENIHPEIALYLLVLYLALKFARRASDGFLYITDRIALYLPYFGEIIRLNALARLAQYLSVLHSSGIPLFAALTEAADSSGNRYISAQAAHVADRVKDGESLSKAFAAEKFDPMMVKMITSGEDSGYLSKGLDETASYYSKITQDKIDAFVAYLGPAMTLIIGLIFYLTLNIPGYTD